MDETSTSPPTEKQRRAAGLASALAAGVREGTVEPVDALRVLRHELRRLNTNKALKVWPRSVSAHEVIARYAAVSEKPPKNGSLDALHCDHVFALRVDDLHAVTTPDGWIRKLAELRRVVCVTAEENYRLELVEKQGLTGMEKYDQAGIDLLMDPTEAP